MFGSGLPLFPKTVNGAIFKIAMRLFGLAFAAFGALAVYTIMQMPDGVATWTNFSTYPPAPLFINIIDLCIYAIGAAPMLFIAVFMTVTGVRMILGHQRPHAEVTVMQVFIAAVSLSISLALIVPNMAFGGLLGTFAAMDLAALVGPTGALIIGAMLLALFILLGSAVLGITIGGALKFFYTVGKIVAWPFAKLMGRASRDYSDVSFDEYNPPKKKRAVKSKAKPKKSRAKKSKDADEDEEEEEEIEYELPPPELLEKSNFQSNVVTREHRDIAASMEINFTKFGIRGAVREIHPGPIVTRYDFEPEDGQKISKVEATSEDMRRAMATEQIRIALVPRTRYIGIEMVNPKRQLVFYQTMMSSPEFTESEMKIPLALGVDIGGRPFYADLAKMPHVLIAGRTGSGKSVFVQSIITSIVYSKRPDETKLIIVDPKGVDFNKWKNIPHLITPIVTDVTAAVNVLKWAVREMEDRFKHLKQVETQNIADYNDLVDRMNAKGRTFKKKVMVGTNEEGEPEYEIQESRLEKMPYIVLVMDEIADLMMQARKEVEACVQRITQKARAAGIHLVAATQRPDVTVITGVIKSNLPTRISFNARSNIDSRTTLGEGGAEMLLSQGDMLYSANGPPIRVHGAWIQDKEIEKVAKFLRAQGMPEYIDGITESSDDMDNSVLGLPPSPGEQNADLYNQAVEIVVRDKKPTTSYIQRRLGIGYNKAATLIEKMEANGVIKKTPGGKYEIA